jgi:hypothetical protein
MLFFAFTTSISLFNTYWQVNYYTQEAQIELDNNKDIVFNSSTSFNEEDIFLFNFWGNWTSLESITGTTLKVEIEYKFLWNDYIENTFKNAIFNPELVKNGSTIEFKDTNMLSSKVIPYILFIERHTIVYVPEWYTIKFDGYLPFIVNTDVIFEDERYENFNRVWNCVGRKMWYSAEKWTFVCLATESEVNDAKKWYLINYVIENFDSISPVTHKNIYKRDYTQHYSNISVTSDWNFWYSDWRDKDTLEIKFSDMSLTINASLDIIETDTWATVSDFRINSVGVDEWYFDEKYYNNIGAIAEWLGIWYEESFSEIINNISEGNIEGYSEITNSVSSGNILTEDENSISPIY